MPKFLIDEDLPRSPAKSLQDNDFEVLDVRTAGLRGRSDADVFRFAVEHSLILPTGDLDFSNLLHYPLGGHSGIVGVRLPNEMSAIQVSTIALAHLGRLSETDFKGNLLILEPDRIRIRKTT